MIRNRASIFAALLLALVAGACSIPNSPMGIVRTINDARDIQQAATIYQDFTEARRKAIPIRGTYRLTFTLPEEENVTFYVRTLWNANAPIALISEPSRDELSMFIDKEELTTGYMVNAMGTERYQDVPATLDDLQRNENISIGGYLVVTDAATPDANGRTRYVGGWMLMPRDTVGNSAGARVYRALRAAGMAEQERYAALSERERRLEPQDALEAMNTIFYQSADGSVVSESVSMVNGREFYRLRAERIDTIAYRIPDENIYNPLTGK